MPIRSALPLGVLEAAWFDKSHLSVKPLFDLLSVIFTDKHDQYAYERFVGKQSFDEVHKFLCARPDINYIYVAAHGEKNKKTPKTSIACPNKEKISPTLLKNDLKLAARSKGGRVDGAYYGTCFFATAFTRGLSSRKFMRRAVSSRGLLATQRRLIGFRAAWWTYCSGELIWKDCCRSKKRPEKQLRIPLQ
jgi:hypothetical protein